MFRLDLVILIMLGFLEVCFWVGYYYLGKLKGKFFNEKFW